LVDPFYGVLILEAKGGMIEYDHREHAYFRRIGRGVEGIKDPFKQAQRNMRVLKGLIDNRLPQHFQRTFTFAYAAVFPDCNPNRDSPPGAEPAIVIGERDLPVIDRRLDEVFQRFRGRRSGETLPQQVLQAIQLGLSPQFKLLPVLYRVRDQEEAIFRMTEEQEHLLDFLAEHDRAEIRGVAGSGKTKLAVASAQRFAEQEKNVLFLCFNRMLADWLKAEVPERYKRSITIRGYHELCYEWSQRAGLEWNHSLASAAAEVGSTLARKQDHYWNDEVPEILLRATERLPDRFDAVVIDEGQDFRPNWWATIEFLLREPGRSPFYLFHDPAQSLRLAEGEQSFLPDLGKPYPLLFNCRNTREIANRCGRIRQVEIKVRSTAPFGDAPRWIHAPTKQEQIRECAGQLREWLSEGGLKRSQVVLMCMGRSSSAFASSLGGLTELAGHPLLGTLPSGSREQSQATRGNLDRWRTGEAVLVTTIRRFRGLESDAVIIFDLPALAPEHLSTRYMRDCEQPTIPDLYVALSRAKHLATIVSFVSQPVEFG
jgi:superfamily I DNA/RNA helicase